MDAIWISVFIITFCVMEFNAWFLHKYVMHGFLWVLHEDHHTPVKGRWWQLNDAFALFFAVPSFLFILFDSLYSIPLMGAVGYGIMAYGFCYFFIHEVIIHRRLKFLSGRNNWYFEAVNAAHKVHHAVRTKEDGANFGMLVVPIHYFADALKRKAKRQSAN